MNEREFRKKLAQKLENHSVAEVNALVADAGSDGSLTELLRNGGVLPEKRTSALDMGKKELERAAFWYYGKHAESNSTLNALLEASELNPQEISHIAPYRAFLLKTLNEKTVGTYINPLIRGKGGRNNVVDLVCAELGLDISNLLLLEDREIIDKVDQWFRTAPFPPGDQKKPT